MGAGPWTLSTIIGKPSLWARSFSKVTLPAEGDDAQADTHLTVGDLTHHPRVLPLPSTEWQPCFGKPVLSMTQSSTGSRAVIALRA